MGLRLGIVAALLLVGGAVWAAPVAPVGRFAHLEPLGWTADGRAFAFRAKEVEPEGGMSGPGEEAYTADVGVVVDAATGEATYYLVKLDGVAHAETKRRLGPPRAKALDRWIAAHAPQVVRGRHGAAIAVANAKDLPPLAGGWSGARWSFASKDDDAVGAAGVISIAVGRGVVLRLSEDGGAGNCSGSITPLWSPDGRRVAWWVHRDLEVMDFPAYDELWITGARGARVDVKPDKALSPAARAGALRALDRAGFAAVLAKEADARRAKTVVYAAPGFEADARRAAAALGGTVDKLTWRPDADLVVALGGGGPAFACGGRKAVLVSQPAHGPAFLVTLSCDGDVPRVTSGPDPEAGLGVTPTQTTVTPAAWDAVWAQLEAAHWRTAPLACHDPAPDGPGWTITVSAGATRRTWSCPDGAVDAAAKIGSAIWNAQQLPGR